MVDCVRKMMQDRAGAEDEKMMGEKSVSVDERPQPWYRMDLSESTCW